MSALGRGRGTWKKPEQTRVIPDKILKQVAIHCKNLADLLELTKTRELPLPVCNLRTIHRGKTLYVCKISVKFFPVAVGSFFDRGSDAIDNAAKKFMQDSEFILNSSHLEDCIIELVRQHPGGLLAEHLPGEYQHVYGKPILPEWSSVVEKCPDLTEDNAPGLGPKILYNSTFANYINQETENTWIVEVVEVNSTADISVKTDDDDGVEKCSLCALEDLSADVELTVFLKEVLCQRVFTCHLVSLENPPSVVFYDGSNNLNLRFAEQTALQAAPIQLKEGMSPCVRVTYIADNMSVCVRLIEQYFELLKQSLNMVMRLKSETRHKRFVVCKKDLKKLCALRINSNWYRVAVKSQDSLNEVTVILVDVGSSISVDPFSLIVLDSISTVFSNVPPQAVEVVLDPLHNPPHVHDLLLGAKNQRSDLVMKVLKSDKLQPPVVVFRDPADTNAFSSNLSKLIGDSVSHQQDGSSVYPLNTSSSLSANSVVYEEKPKPSSEKAIPYDSDSNLKYWKSLTGKHFKVYVFSAKSPLDIMLQLSKNRPSLEMLMEMIQEHYNSRAYILDDPGELQLETAYAAFIKDWWYRVRIVRVCGEDVWVHLMDYGTSASVRPKQIRKLPKELGQEIVAFQSLRAVIKGARELMSANQEAVKGLDDILSDKTFTCKVWSVESDYICPARIEVDLYDDAGNSILEILYPAAASAC